MEISLILKLFEYQPKCQTSRMCYEACQGWKDLNAPLFQLLLAFYMTHCNYFSLLLKAIYFTYYSVAHFVAIVFIDL